MAARAPTGASGRRLTDRRVPRGSRKAGARPLSVASLAAGSRARVVQITGVGPLRDRLLDMGLLPDVVVEVARAAAGANDVELRVQGFGLRLSGEEARAVQVAPPATAP